jgi:adenylate cyclase class 2
MEGLPAASLDARSAIDMARETEVKIPIANLRSIRNKLQALGLVEVHKRTLEDNVLFDTPDRTLRKARCILRLRRYGSGWWITYKGTPDADPHYKSRVELETEVNAPDAVRGIFQALGLVPVFRYQKYRAQFVPKAALAGRKPRLEIALDETPIGDFMELEGSRAAIDRIARQFGYSRRDYNTASYGALYLEECQKRNRTPTNMVFERGRKHARQRPRSPIRAAEAKRG